MKNFIIFSLMVLSLVLALNAISAENQNLTILYTGATSGKMQPCTCGPDADLGGLSRRDTALAELRKSYPDALLVDAGGSFAEPSYQGKLEAQAYLDMLQILGYDALALGPGDLVYGRGLFTDHAGSFALASNLQFKKQTPWADLPRDITRGSIKIRLLALASPEDVNAGRQTDATVIPPPVYVVKQLSDDRLLVVLCNMPREKALPLLDLQGVDAMINAEASLDESAKPLFQFANGKVYAETAIYSSRIGVLHLSVKDGGILAAQNSLISLDKSFAPGARVRPIIERFEKATKKIFLDTLAGRPLFDKKASPFTGGEACRACHAEAYKVWENSGHAQAWAALKKTRRNFDPECIVCHSVGYGQPGGFFSEQDSPDLINVSCETCHGPGKAHSANGETPMAKTEFKDCLRCHIPDVSPNFQAESAWAKIKH